MTFNFSGDGLTAYSAIEKYCRDNNIDIDQFCEQKGIPWGTLINNCQASKWSAERKEKYSKALGYDPFSLPSES